MQENELYRIQKNIYNFPKHKEQTKSEPTVKPLYKLYEIWVISD